MRRALVVGIDEYQASPLAGCVKDAQSIAALLRENYDGSPNFDCRVLTAPPEGITHAALRHQISELLEHKADVAILYFSGHGTENNLGGYIVTTDARRYDEGVSMTDILTLANRSRVHEVVILLDCCHSGALGALPPLDNEHALLREGISILTASRSDQAAVEAGGAGLFTTLVCSALDEGAADVIGNVTVAGVYAYLDQALGPWDQRPLFKAHVSRLTTLRKCKPAVALEIIREFPRWFPTPDSEFPLDPSFEPKVEPHDLEHEATFGLLQKCRAAKLIEPVGEEHMYFAAMNSKSCCLTPLGRHYWRLAREGRV